MPQPAVSRILSASVAPARARCGTIIPLVPTLLAGSSDLPGSFGRAVLTSAFAPCGAPARYRFPIWSCSVRGFACHLPYGKRGALLPHLFTLTLLRPLTPFGQASYGGQAPDLGPAAPERA